jgi:hypothetical protein
MQFGFQSNSSGNIKATPGVAHAAQTLANQGCISQQEKGKIVSEAARSSCGKKSKK